MLCFITSHQIPNQRKEDLKERGLAVQAITKEQRAIDVYLKSMIQAITFMIQFVNKIIPLFSGRHSCAKMLPESNNFTTNQYYKSINCFDDKLRPNIVYLLYLVVVWNLSICTVSVLLDPTLSLIDLNNSFFKRKTIWQMFQ